MPREVTLSGRRLTRRCENYFLPIDATAKDVELLFDHMAPRYESVTDTALNGLVSRRLLQMAVESRARRGSDRPRIADFGCGSGKTWLELLSLAKSEPEYRRVELFGCDLSAKMVDLSRRRGFTQAFRCSYTHTTFETSFFDVVIATFVMHYFSDHEPLSEITRILRPGGLFIASLPSAEREDLEHYRSMLHKEPSLRRIEVSAMETNAEQPRQILIFQCEKLEVGEVDTKRAEADFPDEPLLV